MATITEINTELYTILNGLTGSGQPLEVAYDYPATNPTGFPYAFPYIAGGSEDHADTSQNEAHYRFFIRVGILDEENESSYDQIMDVADKVLIELRKDANCTLQGKALKLNPTDAWEVRESSDSQSKLVFIDIEIIVDTLVSTS